MSVMMGFGSQGPPGGPTGADVMYAPSGCGLSPHPLTTHDSGIDMSPHELDSHGSDSQDMPPTQEIEYHDASSSSDSRASFSDTVSMSMDEYSEGGAVRGSPHVAERPTRSRRRRSPPKATFDINDNSLVSVYTFFKTFLGASTASTVAIDNKIEQAMDLVKSHLMFAVREEVDVLKDRIVELMDRIKHLECENTILRQYASPEVLQQLQSQMPHQMQQPAHHSSTS